MNVPYRVERWTERGVTSQDADTKAEANRLAALLRTDPQVQQSIVVKPNGDVRVCRNPDRK